MDCANAVHLGCVGDLVSGKLGHVMITGRRLIGGLVLQLLVALVLRDLLGIRVENF